MIIIFRITKIFLYFISVLSFAFSIAIANENKVNLKLESFSPECDFLFQSYFTKFIFNLNNSKIFSLDKTVPGVVFSKTDNLDLTAQVTVKKGKAEKSPTLTLFFALEKNKALGNFIIPAARQKLCKGKFKVFNSTQKFASKDDPKTPKKVVKKISKNNFIPFDKNKNLIKYSWTRTDIFLDIENDLFYYRKRNSSKFNMLHSLLEKEPSRKLDSTSSYSLEIGSQKANFLRNWRKANQISAVKNSKGVKYLKILVKNFGNLKKQIKMISTNQYLFFDLSSNASSAVHDNKSKFGTWFRINHSSFSRQTSNFRKQLASYDLDKRIKAEKLANEKIILEKENARRIAEEKKLAREKAIKLAESNAKKIAEEQKKILQKQKAKKLAEAKATKLAEQKARKIAEAKAKKLAEQKAKKLAEAKATKLAEQKARKIAEAKAKKLAEQKQKNLAEAKKLAEEKYREIINKAKTYKSDANSFYEDIDNYVKSGAEIDLLQLTEYYSVRPDTNNKWNVDDINNYENLRNFMSKNSDFLNYENKQKEIRQNIYKDNIQKINNFFDLNENLLNKVIRDNFGTKIGKEGIELNKLIISLIPSDNLETKEKLKSRLENFFKLANVNPIYSNEKKKIVKTSENLVKQTSENNSQINNNNIEVSQKTEMIETKNNEKIKQELPVKDEVENKDSGFFETIFGSIIDFFAYIFNFISDIFGSIFNFIGYVFGGIFDVFGSVFDIFGDIFNFIIDVFGLIFNLIFNGDE